MSPFLIPVRGVMVLPPVNINMGLILPEEDMCLWRLWNLPKVLVRANAVLFLIALHLKDFPAPVVPLQTIVTALRTPCKYV